MGQFDSPLGKTTIRNQGDQRRFTVTDESEGSVQRSQQAHPQFSQQPQIKEQNFNASGSVAPGFDPSVHQRFNPEEELRRQPDPGMFSSKNHSAEDVMAFRQRMIEERSTAIHQSNSNDRRKLEVLLGIGREYRDVSVSTSHGNLMYRIQTLKSKERQHVAQAVDNLFKIKTQDALHDVRNIILAYSIQSVDGIPLDTILNSHGVPDEDRFYIREHFVQEMDDNLASFLFQNFEILDQEARARFSLDTEKGVKEVADAIKKSE